ncbi:DUF5683 domain-containing protein [Ichthyenterobacterium magnum]|uniref:DUF5683 domain-containing protein n=1 Tax=Ichthyenterobacterium magnum TaxID=1230530 RepID=A0A420DGU3_9FLAO|nr:DUF5683 domain-containing protein [Ichthyenterobacterium magnum]RKE92302.1 hypothetical protein BXY80_2221 [Ichthyenterobacterium magnum]
MPNKYFHTILFTLLFACLGFSQVDDTLKEVNTDLMVVKDSISMKREPINLLAPSRAAFYSAVLPGLGQAHNKKYWKIPLVYAAIGIPVYFYIDNNNEFKRYRNAYKRRLAGFKDDEFFGTVSDEGLINAQESLRRNKELSLLIAIGAYALNIIDANVDAHLLQYNVDENLAIKPHFKYNERENSSDLGLTLNFKF